MSGLLKLVAEDEDFATGRVPCTYREDGRDAHKLFVPVLIEGKPADAMLDTGGAYLVCTPVYGELLGLNRGEGDADDRLRIRGTVYKGELFRVSLTLEPQQGGGSSAAEGTGMMLDVTAFVLRQYRASSYIGVDLGGKERGWIDIDDDEMKDFPPVFLGLHGCLEQIRFAVDIGPVNNDDAEHYFYFGKRPSE